MIRMIAYISVPYSMKSHQSQSEAILYLNKYIARFTRLNKDIAAVNALYSIYKNPSVSGAVSEDEAAYPICRTLIDSADIFIIVRRPNWEYSNLLMNECHYAAHIKKPITYEQDYFEQSWA